MMRLGLLEKEKGKHFDARLVDCFLGIMPELLKIKTKYAEAREMEYRPHLQIICSGPSKGGRRD